AADSEFQYFVVIKDCTFSGGSTGTSGGGVYLNKIINGKIQNCNIKNLRGDAIHFAGGGDPTSSSIFDIKGCQIGPCSGWGLSGLFDGGHTEFSFLRVEDTLFLECGSTSSSVPPTSGGLAWRGLTCMIENTAFTETQNTCVYVAQGGTASNL